jgi:uncharacterized protein YgbK (DUF1537 family)
MAQGPRVLIVADDLTGAMDTAGPFAQQGLKTIVVAQPLACDPALVAPAQVVSLDTASRHLKPADAAKRVSEILGRLGRQSFDIVFKKIDSTLRGNVVSETLALLRGCGRGAALIAPAFPAQGRTVRGAMVHVNGTPLPQTSFARDALSPPPTDSLVEVFARAVGAGKVGSWSPGATQSEAGRSIVIADSQTDADLDAALETAKPQLGRMLLVGSAGLGNALARILATGKAASRPPMMVDGPIVFVVGSRAVQSHEQVERLKSLVGTEVLEAPNGVPAAAPIEGALQIVIVSVPDPTEEADSAAVAAALARAALGTVRRSHSQALVATGGDTAIAVLEASGCAALEVLGDLMPGLPYARLSVDEKPLWLVTKAGGFGGRDTLYEIALRLRGGSNPAADQQ